MSDLDAEMAAFLELAELPSDDRARRLLAIDDPVLRQRLDRLLQAHAALEAGAPEPTLESVVGQDLRPTVAAGTLVDGFRILRVVGRGGMGVVYEAEQQTPQRRVALKTLPLELAGPESARRLEREARLLARLTHPGIAAVYGSGRAEALGGAPYLVMEFIDGEPLDRYAQSRGLPPFARLSILATIAEAVSHAHARGVIHRDLKPGNVLVDPQGQPKVLDFGIGRLDQAVTGTSEPSVSLRTHAGQVLGTLPYMAPEQFTGDPASIDVRADVYALGVIGYELLTQRLPIDVAGLPLAVAARRIAEREPVRLGAHQRQLRGDVELVIGKAMAKDPELRYATAGEFAADLRRLLAHEPVFAHPPSRVYRLRKLISRHRTVAIVLTCSFVGLVVALWQIEGARATAVAASARANAAAGRETLRAHAARELNRILADIVDRATPQRHGGAPVDIVHVVDDLERSVDRLASGDVWVRASVHLFLAKASQRSGRYAEAEHHLQQAREAFDQSALTDWRDQAQVAITSARVAMARGRTAEAIALLERTRSAVLAEPDHDEELLAATSELVNAFAASDSGCEAGDQMALQAIDLARARWGEQSRTHASALHSRALLLSRLGRREEAIDLHRDVVAIRRIVEPDSLALAAALQNLAHALQLAGRLPEALAACEEALPIQRRIHAVRPHRDLAYTLSVQASLLRDLRRPEEALPKFAEAAGCFAATLGEQHPDHAICLAEWGIALLQLERVTEAETLLDRAVSIHRQASPDGSAALAGALEALSHARLSTDGAAAIAAAREAVLLRKRIHGSNHEMVGRALEALGTALLLTEHHDECERVGRELLALRQRCFGEDHWLPWRTAVMIWVPLARRGAAVEALHLARRAVAALTTNPDCVESLRHALEAQRDLEQLTGQLDAAEQTAARLLTLQVR